jgi:hypothetical protein
LRLEVESVIMSLRVNVEATSVKRVLLCLAILVQLSQPAAAQVGWLARHEPQAQGDWRRYEPPDRLRHEPGDGRRQERGIGMGEAVERVQRMTGGRVLSADPVGGGYRVKVLSHQGEVRVFFVDRESGSVSSSR